MAQRVMDIGDAGHILLSKRAAEDLLQYRHWQPHLHDLGEFEVKIIRASNGSSLHLRRSNTRSSQLEVEPWAFALDSRFHSFPHSSDSHVTATSVFCRLSSDSAEKLALFCIYAEIDRINRIL